MLGPPSFRGGVGPCGRRQARMAVGEVGVAPKEYPHAA